MTEWLVRLQGHEFDLEELSNHFSSDDLNVRRDEDGRHYLRSSDFSSMTDPSPVRERALKKLDRMNGVTKFLSGSSYRPITLDVITEIDVDGNRLNHIMLAAASGGRSRVTANLSVGDQDDAEDLARTPTTEAESLVSLADRDNGVADALRFYERGDWINLYKAWEVVSDAAGGTHAVVNKGWADEDERRRFTGTVQSRAELGDEARHASERFKAPKHAMSLEEAQGFLRSVIQAWVATL